MKGSETMNVTREVITDLLPLYLSGEASPETRALVEEFLRDDPALAALAKATVDREWRNGSAMALAADHELATLRRVKRTITTRSVVTGAAVFLTLLPLSFTFGDAGVRWAWQREPGWALAALGAALLAWVVVGWLAHRLRGTA